MAAMSKVLTLIALETVGSCCGVALLRAGLPVDGESPVIYLREEAGTHTHAERLLPMLDALLREAGLARRDIDAVVFGQGPGGFTGLRVAAGVAQGLALALDVPVLPVVSLRAMASQVVLRAGELAVVALDARMNEVYLAAYCHEPLHLSTQEKQGKQDMPGDRYTVQAPALIPAGEALAWSVAQLPRWSQAAGGKLTRSIPTRHTLTAVAVGDGWDIASGTASLPVGGGAQHSTATWPDCAPMRLAWRDWRGVIGVSARQ